jgi:hypothetical protein
MIEQSIPRREAVRMIGSTAVGMAVPAVLMGCRDAPVSEPGAAAQNAAVSGDASSMPPPSPEDELRLGDWLKTIREEGLALAAVPFGATVSRVGELALGTPYEAYTLEQYIHAGGSPIRAEPLTLSLSRFDCVSLVESCLAVARVARRAQVTEPWAAFAREMERMRYRGGTRAGYASRLHYFSEWLSDNERRGLVQVFGSELGAIADRRPLRFMSNHPESYPALAFPEVVSEIVAAERTLDSVPRWVVPTARIPFALDSLETGDILGFATSIEGLDVTHAAFAHRDREGVMRVLHAPLSGGVVEITSFTIPQYVSNIRQATGILIARPLQGPPD